jgi:P4 family phage/plasmid primase-like protien
LTEQPLYCSICKAETQPLGKPDDVGTQFYKCQNGHQTTKALTQEDKKFHDAFEIQAEQNREVFVDPLNPISAFVNGKGVFKTALVAQYLHSNYHFKIDRATEILYYGDEKTGLWKQKGEIYLQELLANLLGEENTKAIYQNVLHDLKGLSYTDIVFSKKLAVENGLLDAETKEFVKPTLNEMAFHSIPVNYNPNVDSHKLDNWLEFLKQVANPEDIPMLQEWMGYCLLPDYRFHKVLWVHGDGRNGKGVFDRTIQGIIGKDNVANVGLEELDGDHRFALAQLYGKLYNSSSEPTTNKIFRTEVFQKVSGSDTIKAERKNANDRLEFVNCAKLTIIGNKFPKIHTPTTAFKERMMFVKFPNFFDDKAQIHNLEKNWLTDPEQKSAILNWMLDGLQRLIEQNGFTKSKTQEQTEIEFQRTSDPVSAFTKEMGIFQKNLATTRATALDAYAKYCDDIGVGLEKNYQSHFTQGMQSLKPKVKDGWVYKPKKERAWLGFGLKDAETLDMEQQEQPEHQKTLMNIENDSNILENKKAVLTVPTVPNTEKSALGESQFYKNRYCSEECANFDKPSCSAPNWQSLNKKSELPLKCPSYKYVGAGEEVP